MKKKKKKSRGGKPGGWRGCVWLSVCTCFFFFLLGEFVRPALCACGIPLIANEDSSFWALDGPSALPSSGLYLD